MENYTLDVISHHKDFDGKALKKYFVEGIETVGAFGSENFEIRFKNNTWNKIQVKISLDGTDILTGEKATTEPTSKMWVVEGYGTLALKAFPETNNGGASFIFTSADNSVALHTHGDLSNRGIIAAAVYVEGHVEPVRLNEHHWYQPVFDYNNRYKGSGVSRGLIGSKGGGLYGGSSASTSNSFNSESFREVSESPAGSVSSTNSTINTNTESIASDLNDLVSVGAGQYLNQKIVNVNGLTKPLFSETVRVKYLWWDHLKAKLDHSRTVEPHPSGFPADKEVMSLGNTPRLGEKSRERLADYWTKSFYSRF